MKKIFSLLFVGLLALTLSACNSSSASTNHEKITLKLAVPTAPPTLPILRMIETKALGDNVDIQIEKWSDAEQLIAMIQKKEHQMFAFPLTVGATLFNKGVDVRLLNVNTWGVTYFVSSDPSVKTWSDLKGKEIYVPIKSSPPDAFTQYFLNKAGLTPGKDVTIKYATTSEIAQLAGAGKAKYATLIEPQVTAAMAKNKDLKIAMSFEEEWQKATKTDTMIPNAGLATSQAFIDSHPDLVKDFQAKYEEATKWIKDNPKEAGALAQKHLGMNANIVEKSMPRMGLVYKSAKDSEKELDLFYKTLYEFNPKMIGGKIPDKTLYYND